MTGNALPSSPNVATGRFQFAALFLGLCLAVLTQALDNTILATAIPKITDEFNSLADVGWYGAGYLLTTCSFQLFYGKLYNLYPIKWIFLGALGLFELGSLICGAAPNSIALIMGRVVAGIGTGGIFSGATLIIAELKPLHERPLYNGVLGSMFAIASVGGPLLGGLFADAVTWRLCFYVNLPLGLVTAIIVFLVVPNTYNAERQSKRLLTFKQKLSEMDLPGLLVLVPAIICVLLAVQWGGRYPWNSGRVISLFVVGGLLAILFIVLQVRQGDRAIVPPSVIRRRTVWACAFFSFNLFGSFLALSYYLPIWFQAIKRDTATQSGIHNLPSILATTILSVVAGGLVFGVGYYTWACLLGSVLAAVGSGLLTTLESDTSSRNWIGYQILYGAGIGFGLNQPLIAVQTALPVQQIAEGTSLIGFTQIFGGTIIITIAQNVFTNRLVANVRTQGIPVDPQRLLAIGATQLRSLVEPQYFERLQFAYNETITQTFYVVVATASLSLFGSALIPWFSVKKKPQDFADPDAEMSSPVSTQDRKLT